MLRQTLKRKALCAQTINSLRRVHDQTNILTPPPSSFAARASHEPAADDATFPLYRPPPPEAEDDLQGMVLDAKGLPSMDWIQRETKSQIVRRAIEDVAEYEEADLRDFYKQVVLSGAPKVSEDLKMLGAPDEGPMSKAQRYTLLSGLSERLRAKPDDADGRVALLPAIPQGTPEHVALTAALLDIAPEESASSLPVPLGVVRKSEWQALFDAFLDRSDAQGAEVLLSTMQRHGIIPTTEQLDRVVELYARRGQTTEVARLISDFEIAGLEISNHHRDLLISSYLHGARPDSKGAIAILTASENMGRPFPQSSYNVVLSHLVEPTITTQTDSHSRALAWDLFAHMRFAAHPVPDRELYATMIRCCGVSADPQPERARDLWIEFTTEGGKVEPRREEYDAIIRALGSTKSDYLEAYDLLRQMLAKHHEATFVPFEEEDTTARMSPWVPTVETFTALLEGTKRAADLDRARWVLSEVVDLARAAAFTGSRLKGPDEELMTNVFMTYASWNPPVTRQSVKIEKKAGGESAVESTTVDEVEEGPSAVVESENQSGSDMPRTSAEALLEVDLLFERVVHDARAAMGGEANVVHYPFASVRITTRLVNSYLAAQLKHANNYADGRAIFDRVWGAFTQIPNGPKPNGWTFLQVMDKCSRGRLSKDDRSVAFAWGKDAWKDYEAWSATTLPTLLGDTAATKRKRWLLGLGERQIERQWTHAIRLFAMEGDIATSLKLLAEFVKLYPSKDLLTTYAPKLRTPGFMFNMVDPATVAEPNIPPHLLFKDLDVVHQACVRDEDWAGVKQIKFATTSYLNALKKRRKWRVGGAGVKRELGKIQQHDKLYVRPGSLDNKIAQGEVEEDEE